MTAKKPHPGVKLEGYFVPKNLRLVDLNPGPTTCLPLSWGYTTTARDCSKLKYWPAYRAQPDAGSQSVSLCIANRCVLDYSRLQACVLLSNLIPN